MKPNPTLAYLLAHAGGCLPHGMELADACVPHDKSPTLPEILYCAYQLGGPRDRMGLAVSGFPCPTWAKLQEDAAERKEAQSAVVEKWEATANIAAALAVELATLVREGSLSVRAKVKQESIVLAVPEELSALASRAWSQLNMPLLKSCAVLSVLQPRLIVAAGVFQGLVLELGGAVYQIRLYVLAE